jgi:GLPGLI family protein
LALSGILKIELQKNKFNCMKNIIVLVFGLTFFSTTKAQIFIDKGSIEFEVKTNLKKTMGDGQWAQMMEDKIPTFKTAYYNYTFANGKSIFKLDHFSADKIPEYMKKEDEENEWFMDFTNGSYQMKKVVAGSPFFISDTLGKIKWKLSNENRIIAGFNCRKATGVINDSVYVFAFYTDEIVTSGGPCSINGLPGMMLGLTIPRLYTSWIATKISLVNINEAIITAPNSKKMMTLKDYNAFLKKRTEDWGGDEESKQWINQFIWNSLL